MDFLWIFVTSVLGTLLAMNNLEYGNENGCSVLNRKPPMVMPKVQVPLLSIETGGVHSTSPCPEAT
jgi:hypothetical protein